MSKENSGPISQAHSRAMMKDVSHVGYGHVSVPTGGKPGFSKGGSVSKHTASHKTMDGHLGHGSHHHSHKSHGHGLGVHHETTKGVPAEPHGAGGTKGPGKGPSSNQFGPGEPHGGSVGKW